jgi:hypothetical protein
VDRISWISFAAVVMIGRMKTILSLGLALVMAVPAFGQKPKATNVEQPVAIDGWTWERAPETYTGKLVTLKGELVNIIPDSRRLIYRYILRAKWKREPNPAIEIDNGESGEIQVPVYFSANLKDLRRDANMGQLVLEVKGRVASDGSQTERVGRDSLNRREYRVRGDLAICSAELVSKEKKTNEKTEERK